MDSSLQSDVLDRLARDPAFEGKDHELVLAALPACLEGWMSAAK